MGSSRNVGNKDLHVVRNISEERRSRPRYSRGSIGSTHCCFIHNDRTGTVAHPPLLPAVPAVKLPVCETGRLGFVLSFPPYGVVFCCGNLLASELFFNLSTPCI